jgi:hypothetical protein
VLCACAQDSSAPPPPPSKAEAPGAGDARKNGARAATVKTQSAPVSPNVRAAQDLLAAVGAGVEAAEANNPERDFQSFRTQQADLLGKLKLASDAEAIEISRQAVGLLASLYQPTPNPSRSRSGPAPPVEPASDSKLPVEWRLWGLAILVALLSPLICVAGFYLGGRTAENNLRSTFREAGLL